MFGNRDRYTAVQINTDYSPMNINVNTGYLHDLAELYMTRAEITVKLNSYTRY